MRYDVLYRGTWFFKRILPDAPEEGIYILGDDAVVGSSAVEYLGLNDTVFEYEITNNRVDCYSVIGIAREAAATFRKPFNPPVVTKTGNDEDVNTMVSVDIEAKELCSRYVARVVKNIRLAPSPNVDAAKTYDSRYQTNQQHC